MGEKWPYWPQNADRIEIFGTQADDVPGRHGGGLAGVRGRQQAGGQKTRATTPTSGTCPTSSSASARRKQPNGDIEQGHYSACLEHLANVAYRSGSRLLAFDAKTETFVGNELANNIAAPHFRGDYRIDEKV